MTLRTLVSWWLYKCLGDFNIKSVLVTIGRVLALLVIILSLSFSRDRLLILLFRSDCSLIIAVLQSHSQIGPKKIIHSHDYIGFIFLHLLLLFLPVVCSIERNCCLNSTWFLGRKPRRIHVLINIDININLFATKERYTSNVVMWQRFTNH